MKYCPDIDLRADWARKGQRLQKPRQAQSLEMGKFDLHCIVWICILTYMLLSGNFQT